MASQSKVRFDGVCDQALPFPDAFRLARAASVLDNCPFVVPLSSASLRAFNFFSALADDHCDSTMSPGSPRVTA